MKAFPSCKAAIQSCLSSRTFAIAHLYNDEKVMNIHIHDCYEIYYSISGGKQFLIDNRFYAFHPGDIFFINQYESHHVTQIDSERHERIVLSIHPEYLQGLSTANTNLNYCFSFRGAAAFSLPYPQAVHHRRVWRGRSGAGSLSGADDIFKLDLPKTL